MICERRILYTYVKPFLRLQGQILIMLYKVNLYIKSGPDLVQLSERIKNRIYLRTYISYLLTLL